MFLIVSIKASVRLALDFFPQRAPLYLLRLYRLLCGQIRESACHFELTHASGPLECGMCAILLNAGGQDRSLMSSCRRVRILPCFRYSHYRCHLSLAP